MSPFFYNANNIPSKIIITPPPITPSVGIEIPASGKLTTTVVGVGVAAAKPQEQSDSATHCEFRQTPPLHIYPDIQLLLAVHDPLQAIKADAVGVGVPDVVTVVGVGVTVIVIVPVGVTAGVAVGVGDGAGVAVGVGVGVEVAVGVADGVAVGAPAIVNVVSHAVPPIHSAARGVLSGAVGATRCKVASRYTTTIIPMINKIAAMIPNSVSVFFCLTVMLLRKYLRGHFYCPALSNCVVIVES